MKYLFSDFYLLCGAADGACRTVGDAYASMSAALGSPASAAGLLHALRGLAAGGYVTLSPEDGRVIHPLTPLAITEAGRGAVAISPLRKLLGEAKAMAKNELRFCSLDRPLCDGVGEDWWVDPDAFARLSADALQRGDLLLPLFSIGEDNLTVHHPSDTPEEDPDAPEQVSALSIAGDPALIRAGLADLLEAAHALLTDTPRTRKVALHGADRSLVVTLSLAGSEQGTVLRMSVSRILFNRKRFLGKRDSDLDYAQCSDPLLVTEMGNALHFAARLLPCAASAPMHLTEEMAEVVSALHRLLK